MEKHLSSEKDIQADIEAIGNIPAVPNILEVICQSTGMGLAVIARVTEARWVACGVRDEISSELKPGGELDVENTICGEICETRQVVVIEDIDQEENPLWRKKLGKRNFRSYISVPIILKNGKFFGTLCAIDFKPANLNKPEIIGMFNLFAELIAAHLDTFEKLAIVENKLREERRLSRRRDRFIAILGHDLRNPLGAIISTSQFLRRQDLGERNTKMMQIIYNSSYRMKGLIDNILDLARGQLGTGIKIDRRQEDIENILDGVIKELQAVWHNRDIVCQVTCRETIYCDAERMAQVFSNLLSNALTHGDLYASVQVRVSRVGDKLLCTVTNAGEKIPDAIMEHLFKPFSQGERKKDKKGLGLGLYIASEIVRAHGGSIEAHSTDEQTCFTIQLPLLTE
ncbi:GAF domain-containing sensor histidine kinase [Olivibacter sitiensis]|uniref:GAF domain-containing sensor histidine kinase n=1 Tax=Olivibacter sitiensis TaxID=376470 RepID=UPI0004229C6F|nr:GAF domain-containing sensor histidine kinase [Olivibacter sitiensis]